MLLTLRLVFAAVVKLALLSFGLIMMIALSPVATASTAGVAVVGRFILDAPLEQSSDCDPNYKGACVPIDSDVDCEGGGGNGPSYVSGPVYVVGKDIYGLDNNHDGVGCES
jgi:hypothetical protein